MEIPNPILPETNENLPLVNLNRVLTALRSEKNASLPVWIMGQTGEYLPEFKKLQMHHQLSEICKNPELAARVSLMPVERFELDVAIILNDMVAIPKALGMEVLPQDGEFILTNPLTPEDMDDQIRLSRIRRKLNYLGEAIRSTRQLVLKHSIPVFGFARAPWTLMAYMIEGRYTQTCNKARKWLYAYPDKAHKLLQTLTMAIIEFLKMQVLGGADMLQIVDQSADCLNLELYKIFGIPYLKQIRDELVTSLGDRQVPMALYTKGAYFALHEQAALGFEILGVDSTSSVEKVQELHCTFPNLIIQDNLDPCVFYGSLSQMTQRTRAIISAIAPQKHLINLGLGSCTDVGTEAVEAFVKFVRAYK